jgi:hypothetical protein
MIKPWLFEFLPELGSPSLEPEHAYREEAEAAGFHAGPEWRCGGGSLWRRQASKRASMREPWPSA